MAVDLDFLFTVNKARSARAGGLITGKQDRIAIIADIVGDMVQNPSARGHAACGNDDRRHIAVIQHF